jgi:hypothetical protein
MKNSSSVGFRVFFRSNFYFGTRSGLKLKQNLGVRAKTRIFWVWLARLDL